MSFEDPFANDLNNFRSVTAGLRPTAASPAGSNVSRGLGNANALATPLAASPTQRGQLGAGLTGFGGGGGGGLLLPGSGASGVSLFPSAGAANAAPVAGRRARGTPSASSPLSAAPSSVPPSLLSAASPPLAPQPQPQLRQPQQQQVLAASPAASAAPSALSWLDGMDAGPPAAGRRQGPPLQPPPAAPPTQAAAAGAVPSFLNFDAADGVGDVGPPQSTAQLAARQGAAGPTGAALPTAPPPDAAAVAAAKQKSELRELYATLDALDMEQQRLEDRLEARQLKEENELLALETNVMARTNELADKEEELASKHAELAAHTAERLAALASRYAREMESQAAEVHTLDGARFEKQLQQVRTQCTAVEEAVRGLQEQAALALATEPFSERGVRVALAEAAAASSSAAEKSLANLSGSAKNVLDKAESGAEAAEPLAGEKSEEEEGETRSVASASLDASLQRAVELLRAYCDQRLGHAKDRLVDYVHDETLEAAHGVRRQREQSWADDAVQHKTLFSQYMTDMMQRYMVFYKERALLKQQNITSMQEELHKTAAELRDRAAARLQGLLRDVTAKVTLSTEQQAKSADEAKSRLQKQCSAVLEGDAAMATGQRKEVESRLLAEAQARRQRFQAEEQTLLDLLQRLRRSNESASRTGFESVRASAEAAGPQQVRSLDEEVAALKARVDEKLRAETQSQSATAPLLSLGGAASAARMHAEELAHVVDRAVADATAQQRALRVSRQRCEELRRELLEKMQEAVVDRLQHTRCVQHAHQSRIDAQRKVWEAAHRQNLAAACSLLLPVSGSTAGTADTQYTVDTYAAPQDVAAIALLDVVRDKLHSRDTARRQLAQARQECAARCFRLLEGVKGQQESVRATWEDVWTAAQTQLTQQATTHEVQLEVEKSLVAVAAQQQSVERDRRNAARESRRLTEVMQRLKAEAAQCGIDSRLLCAPPELLETEGAVLVVPPLRPPAMTSVRGSATPFLHTLGASDVNRLPAGTNKFTAVHTSSNTAAATCRPFDAPLSTTRGERGALDTPASPAASVINEAQRDADTTRPAPPGAASAAPFHADSSNAADASNATATQPWSSTLLRAEQLLSQSNGDEDGTAAAAPQPMPVAETTTAPRVQEEEEEGAAIAAGAGRGRRSSSGANKNASSSSPRGTSGSSGVVDRAGRMATHSSDSAATQREDSGSTTTATAEEQRRSASSLRSTDVAPQPGSSVTWLDTDTRVPRQQQHRRIAESSSSSLWQLQRPQARGGNMFETFSTLDEFRSGIDRSASAVREHDVSPDGTTFSFDDSTNFVDLLSCTDSPTSSFRTH